MNDLDEPQGEASASRRHVSYTCPGELYSIPRSIHLARLAAFYSKCRDCEHRLDAGHRLPSAEQQRREARRLPTRTSLLTEENVRGVYLNELDRNRALLWGEALAANLWNRQPMVARQEPAIDAQIVAEQIVNKMTTASRAPTVVVGFDERPSSPDIMTGVVLGLRRMGCPVIDLGQTALPVVAFNVRSMDASAGLYVTGAGCDPSSTGFEFLTRRAQPFRYEALVKMELDVKTGVGRQTRKIGEHHPQQGQASYEASLAPHFHALRPLRIVCGSSTRLLPRILDRLFAKLPCELTHVALPTRRRDLFDVHDLDLQRVAKTVMDGKQHLGLVIDEDGQHLCFVTDCGRLVSSKEVARLLIEIAQRENYAAEFVVATSWLSESAQWLLGRDATAIDGGETAANLVRLLVERDAVLALSGDGRIWFHHKHPACDALIVLAKVLQVLSLSDLPFSEVVARIQ